jgi:hypothetical protein
MPTPVTLAIDIEPDPRLVYEQDPRHWDGLRGMLVFVSRLRAALASAHGTVPTFTWLLRMDPQMRRVYGSNVWLADRFRRELEALAAVGDDLGLHTHLYRWDEDRDDWTTDMRDPQWAVDCVGEATMAYREAFGRGCEAHSFGDRWLTEQSLDALEGEGVRVDLTPEPGMVAKPRFRSDESMLGYTPDFTGAPRRLWRPAVGDFLRDDPASPRGIRILPVATYRFPFYFEPGRRIDLALRRSRGDVPSEDDLTQRHVRLCVGQRAYVVRRGLSILMREHSPTTLHFVLRTSQANDAKLLARVEANLVWLARGGLGRPVEFLSATRLLDAVGAADAVDARAVKNAPHGRGEVAIPPGRREAGRARSAQNDARASE